MTNRSTEFSKLVVNVIGRQVNDKNKEVRHTYSVDNVDELLAKYCKTHKGLKESIVDIPLLHSKKYQKVGIASTKVVNENGRNYFHFGLAYIRRDKESILTTKVDDDYKTKTINLDDGVYQYLHLHVTIVPSTGVVLMDTKCHNRPTEFIIQQILSDGLDPNRFLLTTKEQVRDKLRVTIKTLLRDNFTEVLNKRIEQVREMNFTFVKPKDKVKNVSKDLELKHSSDEAVEMFKSVIATVFGKDLVAKEFQDLPLSRLKVSLTIDDGIDAKELKALRKAAKGNLNELIKNQYLKNSALLYQDDETHRIEKALFAGLQLSRENDLAPEYFLDDKRMWKHQREVFSIIWQQHQDEIKA